MRGQGPSCDTEDLDTNVFAPKEAGYQFNVCYISYLESAFMTSRFALEHSDQLHVPELIRGPATSSSCATPRT